MELEFIQNETGKWVAEFQVTSDFNLHLDNVNKRSLKILQKTQGNGYGIVADTLEVRDYTNVYDCDFTGLVYPKFIKIESVEKPIGIITTDGEVTEIKSQSKEVEITANGVTEIAPDAGFGYLSGVKVNVNVPQSGGGGGTPVEDTVEYLDVSGLEDAFKKVIFLFSHTMRADLGAEYPYTMPSAGFLADVGISNVSAVTKISIDFSQIMSDSVSAKTILDRLLEMGSTKEELDAIPRITKEEFYNLGA